MTKDCPCILKILYYVLVLISVSEREQTVPSILNFTFTHNNYHYKWDMCTGRWLVWVSEHFWHTTSWHQRTLYRDADGCGRPQIWAVWASLTTTGISLKLQPLKGGNEVLSFLTLKGLLCKALWINICEETLPFMWKQSHAKQISALSELCE